MVDMDRQFPIPPPGGLDVPGVSGAFAYHMMYSVAKDAHPAKPYDAYEALAYAVRDRLMERWFRTQSDYYQRDAKRVYYLSLEFLIGRLLRNNIANLGARDGGDRLSPRGPRVARVRRGPGQRRPRPAPGRRRTNRRRR